MDEEKPKRPRGRPKGEGRVKGSKNKRGPAKKTTRQEASAACTGAKPPPKGKPRAKREEAQRANPPPLSGKLPAIISYFDRKREEREQSGGEEGGAYTYERKFGRRPSLEPDDLTLDQLFMLASRQMSQEEAAAFLGVSRKTLVLFLKDHEEARESWETGRQYGLGGLRSIQFKMAEENATMAIHLGKVYLGQGNVETGNDLADLITATRQAYFDRVARFVERGGAASVPVEADG